MTATRPRRPAAPRGMISAATESAPHLRVRLRIYHRDVILLGPGKADLLEAIAATGSLAEAARKLGMSYMRAWSLVRTMNAGFATPLVETIRGGEKGGQAMLTVEGRRALRLYRRMSAASLRAAQPAWRDLVGMVRRKSRRATRRTPRP